MGVMVSEKNTAKLKKAYYAIDHVRRRILGKYLPERYSKGFYKSVFGRELDLDNPQTLNEKLMYYKFRVYWDNPLVSQCADKLEVRKYVNECGCPEILNPLIDAWEKPEDINWDILPQRFALKCNHGSGYNIICKNKDSFDREKAVKLLSKWMKETYGYEFAEQGIYSKIKRMVIAEEYIETPDDLPPADYKFFCEYGHVRFLFVATDRYNNNTKFDYYTPDWKWIPVKNDHPNRGPVEKPKALEEMIRYAEKLSKCFPLVRVDFYNVNGKTIFGELTFTHFGCVHRFDPDQYDYVFGKELSDIHSTRGILWKIENGNKNMLENN